MIDATLINQEPAGWEGGYLNRSGTVAPSYGGWKQPHAIGVSVVTACIMQTLAIYGYRIRSRP
jgi:hypothetical protein